MMPAWVKSRIAARTTVLVLCAVLGIGLAADQVAVRFARVRALAQQREALEALLDVVEPSASAACFLEDAALGREVAQGLAGARSVQAAVLRSNAGDLAAATRGALPPSAQTVRRVLHSPFQRGVPVGELLLVQDAGDAARQVDRYTLLVRAVAGSLSLAVALTLTLVVHRGITLPIGQISRRLHSLKAEAGGRLAVPTLHEHDEIGQLVRDVNALAQRMAAALLAERELSERLEVDRLKVQAILENAATGIFLLARNGTLDAWTPAFLRHLGLEDQAPEHGASFPALFGPEAARVEALLARCLAEGGRVVETFPREAPQAGRSRWLQLTLDPIGEDWLQGVVDDVTTHLEATEAARKLAHHDPLTGVLNRLGMEHYLAAREPRPLCLMLVDLDRFKEVNDTLGHDAGDEVLRQAVARMQANLRRTDVLARLGGDEFLLLLEDLHEEATALAVARKLIDSIGAPVPLATGEAVIGASIGITLHRPGVPPAWENALKRADQAMYRSKQAGRNQANLG